jgi:hypothetical protein
MPKPRKLIYSLICLHIVFSFKIVHRGGADRTCGGFGMIRGAPNHRGRWPPVACGNYLLDLRRHDA